MSNQPLGRIQPQSIEAEEMLLACCVIDAADVIPRAIEKKIHGGSFYDPKHGIVFQVLVDMFGAKKPIDIATMAEELKVLKQLDAVGGYAALAQITSRVPTTAQAGFFIDKVKEMAVLREVIRCGTSMVEDCYAYTGDLDQFISVAERRFTKAITNYEDESNRLKVSEVCAVIRKEVEDIRAGRARGDENDLSWGLDSNDRFLKKFRRGELVCLAARPGIGKSSLMRQIVIRNVVRDKKNVVVFTIEVGAEEYVRNTAQALTGVNPREVLKYTNEEQESFLKWCDRIALFDKTLHVHESNASLASIIANVRIHHARCPVDMVVIDYLQLIAEKQEKGENRDMLMGRITRALKQLANELKCVILILSQLNRAMERDERAPMLSDLRESGNIEQDCDRVVFIYRPKSWPDGKEQKPEDDSIRFLYCELLQRKGRNVGEASLSMQFERNAARFLPYDKQTISHTHASQPVSQLL